MTAGRLLALACALVAVSPQRARATAPTIPWVIAQAVPSPTFTLGRGDDRSAEEATDPRLHGGRSSFALRWQVTPFLWSWGIHRSAPRRYRVLVVEPPMRHSGSIELHVTPEWLRHAGLLMRSGLRSHFPLVDRGEALSFSVGTGAWTDGHRSGPSLDVGLHTLFGLFGVQLTHSAGLARAAWALTLQVRVL